MHIIPAITRNKRSYNLLQQQQQKTEEFNKNVDIKFSTDDTFLE
jgi:hypothetical protein